MEKQNVSLFRRKNRWGLTILSVVLCFILAPILGLAVFMPRMMTMLPVALLALLGYVGPASVLLCMGVIAGLSTTFFGAWGTISSIIFLVPVVIVSAMLVDRRRPFWYAVASGCVTMFVSMGAVMGLMALLAGSDVVSAISQMVRQALDASGPVGDSVLSAMMQMGVITAPDGSAITMAGMTDAARGQLVESIILMMDSVLRLEIPMQMATGSVAAGILGQAVLRKGVRSRGDKIDYIPLRKWAVPTGWGRVLGVTLVVLFLLTQFVPGMVASMYYVFSGVFEQVFALQGIAAICYWLNKRGSGMLAQGVVFVLGYLVLGPVAIIFGIADQTFDFSHRRAAMEEERRNRFDPRADQHS